MLRIMSAVLVWATGAAAAPVTQGIGLLPGESVTFINGAEVRCEAGCTVEMGAGGRMTLYFEAGNPVAAVHVAALTAAVEIVLASAEHWNTFRIDAFTAASFAHGFASRMDGVELIAQRDLLEMPSVDWGDQQWDAQSSILAPGPDGMTVRRRSLDVGAR